MRCASCDVESPPTARFCGACGTPLAPACAGCGAAVEPEVRFCTACGTPAPEIDDAPSKTADSASPERRRVSVLFVDLEGFTALAERLDPEEVRAIQARYFELARAVIAAHGGTVEKFIGDAVMAVWGAPEAHEDDPDRAVRAGLAIVDGVGRLGLAPARRALSARAAVTTGEAAVTVGAVGHGMVAGDLVNAAARLQAEAPPGGVLADEATRRLAEGAAEFEPVGALTLKGRQEPMVAHRALSLTTTWPGRRAGMHSGAFVGRDRELRELVSLFDAVADEGRSRLVTVTGIAGIGKSRLAWELGERLEARPEVIAWHAGRAPAYGEEITFAAVAEMVRSRLHLPDGADREMTLRQLHAALTEFVTDDAERRWMAPRLGALLGDDDAATYDRDELFAAWRRFFERVSEAAPSVLVFEDLQWAEPGLLDFIEHLAAWARAHPILILALARPELLDRHPGWGRDLASYTRLHLERLGDAPMRELLADREPALPDDVVGRILEHAGGVPLYAVEVVRILADGDHEVIERRAAVRPRSGDARPSVDVPDSLHGLLAARIDVLPTADRRLLQAAAVLGRRFEVPALSSVAGSPARSIRERLEGLVRRDLLAIDDDVRMPGAGQVSFVQDLVREVAYQRLSRDERRALHLAAARFLEERPDDDEVEALASHLATALALAPDHPDARRLARRAVGALRRSARKAMRLHLADRAVGHLEQTLRIVDVAGRAAVLDEAAAAASAADRLELAEEHLRELAHLHRESGNRADLAATRAQLASVLLMAQRNEPAIAELELALRAHRRVLSDPGATELAAQLARARVIVGDDAGGLEWAERALDASGRLGLEPLRTDVLVTRGTARWRLGDEAGGLADLDRAIEDARASGHLAVELRARNNLAWLVAGDDPRLSSRTAREAVELATTMGVGDMAVQLGTVACAVAIETGEWDWSLATARELEERPIAEAHRIDLAVTTAIIGALRGEREPSSALDALCAVATDLDAQLAAAAAHARAWAAFVDGDLEVAHDLSARAAEDALAADRVQYLTLAGRAAIWMGSSARLEAVLTSFAEPEPRGRAAKAAILTLRAGRAGMEGDTDSTALHAEAAAVWRELDLPLALALTQLDAQRVRGDTAAGDEARAILRGLRADGLLRQAASASVPG